MVYDLNLNGLADDKFLEEAPAEKECLQYESEIFKYGIVRMQI